MACQMGPPPFDYRAVVLSAASSYALCSNRKRVNGVCSPVLVPSCAITTEIVSLEGGKIGCLIAILVSVYCPQSAGPATHATLTQQEENDLKLFLLGLVKVVVDR